MRIPVKYCSLRLWHAVAGLFASHVLKDGHICTQCVQQITRSFVRGVTGPADVFVRHLLIYLIMHKSIGPSSLHDYYALISLFAQQVHHHYPLSVYDCDDRIRDSPRSACVFESRAIQLGIRMACGSPLSTPSLWIDACFNKNNLGKPRAFFVIS